MPGFLIIFYTLFRYCKDKFDDQHDPTIFDNYIKEYTYNGETKYLKYEKLFHKLMFKFFLTRIWDTAGQEEYNRLRPLAYNGTDMVIIAFSIVNRDSFENVKKTWIKDHRKHMSDAKVSTYNNFY